MNKIYKNTLAIIIMMAIAVSSFAQKSFFSDVSEAAAKQNGGTRVIVPQKYRTVSLDAVAMKNFLWSLPSEKNVANRKSTPVLELPMPDGRIAKFNVWESSIQEPALEAKFPEIKTFLGQGIDDPYATIRFDYTPRGFHAQVLTTNGSYYIDPYSVNNSGSYISYFRTDLHKPNTFVCTVEENPTQARPENTTAACLGTTLRTYRLVVACTGEYAQAPGISAGTNPVILHAAIVTSVNRVVGVYEKEVALRMVLVANNNLVEFLNAATDPFTQNNNGNGLLNESQTVIDANIGFANYDIGHTFSTGAGGIAQLSSPCGNSKARGVTGSPSPTGDAYDIDYVAHEMGHQWGGNHSMAGCGSSPNSTKFEVGSGTTIQAYAGICGAENIQPNSDPFFHPISFDEISNFIVSGGGAACAVSTPTGNGLPIVGTLVNSGLTIPISTPFTLTGTATDPDGDPLTYCWEQWDFSGTATWNAGVTAPTGNTVPLFKSRLPKTTGSRTFPDIAVINANYPASPTATMNGLKGETLSPVARAMNFRLTVRDNKAGGGGVASSGGGGCQTSTPFLVTVAGTTPFTVTTPNGGESYFSGSTQTVTWNNAATNAAPFNVNNVRITISTDGGLTYPTELLASTANDGTEAVSMPGTITATAKIRVEALGNIFFDVSNANFALTAPPTGFDFGPVSTTTAAACPAASTLAVTIPTSSFGGFLNPITLTTTAGVPAGTAVTFAPNPVTPGSSSIATLSNTNTLNAGTYSITVSGTAIGGGTKTTTITYIIPVGAGPVLTTQPTSATVCAPNTATFSVATAASPVTYQWQSATAAAPTTFTNIGGATIASYTTGATSAAMSGMSFRCIVSTQCGSTTSSVATLTVNTAAVITAQPANTPACTGLTATFNVTASGTGVTYQWQSSTTGIAGSFINVASGTGATTASYTTAAITGATPTYYRVIVTTTTCAATVPSNTAQLTVSTTTSITTAPTAQTVCVPAAATFTVGASGTGVGGGALTYQWQISTAAVPAYTNIAGATAASYNTGATTATMSGNMYQVVVTGACNTATSTPVMLTANTAAALGSTLPTAQTVCNGVTATFAGSGSGTGVTYQWQSGPSVTGPFTNVTGGTGATTTSYTTAVTTPAMNNTWYQLVVSTTTCPASVNTAPVRLTVNTVAIIVTQPTAQSACIPQTATFNVAATGTGLTYQWQLAPSGSSTFADIAGATAASYTTLATVLSMNGNQYRVNILSTCSPTTPTISNAVVLTVNNPVSITQQPIAQSGCALDNYTFSVIATSPGNTIAYQWQVSTTGLPGSFVNIANGGAYSNVTTNALNITAAPIFLNGYFYRAYLSVPCGTGISSDTTARAKFTLTYKPTIVLTKPATSNSNAAVNSVLTTTVSPGPANAYTYTWKKNGITIPNTLAAISIPLAVDDAGSYQVSIIDPTSGCVALSNIIVTDALTSDNLKLGEVFIFPNPVSSIMTVRYNTSAAATRGTSINIFDGRGSKIFSKAFGITGTNGRMDINMSSYPMGTYMVYVMDANGNKLASGKAVKVQ